MRKYVHRQLTADGARGLVKDGGSRRREVAEQLAQSVGGTIDWASTSHLVRTTSTSWPTWLITLPRRVQRPRLLPHADRPVSGRCLAEDSARPPSLREE